MTHYEKVTREEIARRNYSEGTTRSYLRVLHNLADYFEQPPERLKPDQIREFTAHLVNECRRERTAHVFPRMES